MIIKNSRANKMIEVVNYNTHEPNRTSDFYIGPGSSLEDPYRNEAGRNHKKYREFLRQKLRKKEFSNPEKIMINRAIDRHLSDTAYFVCSCNDPEGCHGKVLKEMVEVMALKKAEKV